MAIIMEHTNGNLTYWTTHGLMALNFQRSSPGIRTYNDTVQGRPGRIHYGQDYDPITITVSFLFKAYDLSDFPLKRDEVLSLLGGIEPFYLYEGVSDGTMYAFEAPGDSPYEDEAGNARPFDPFKDIPYDYIYGKRYYVQRTSEVEIEQEGIIGRGEVTYETVELPFGESAATTETPLEIGDSGDDMEDNIWTLGGAEIFQDLQYTFDNPSTIEVYNGGDEPVNPRYMPLTLTFLGASDNLTIVNETNDTRWEHEASTNSSDEIEVDGIISTRNGQSIVRETTMELLTLAPGWNTITVSGNESGSSLAFKFRYYFR